MGILIVKYVFQDPKIREKLSKPLGPVIDEDSALEMARSCEGMVITVGDLVSASLLRRGFEPKIVIFDDKRARHHDRFPRELISGYKMKRVENRPGVISAEACEALKRLISISGHFALKILGEEDLLGLPAIEAAPVGSLVFYGQPERGIVAVAVDENSKGTARSILERTRVPTDGN